MLCVSAVYCIPQGVLRISTSDVLEKETEAIGKMCVWEERDIFSHFPVGWLVAAPFGKRVTVGKWFRREAKEEGMRCGTKKS